MNYFKDADTFYKEMISGNSDVDTSEHSLIYNAQKPVSYELSYITMIADEIVKMMFTQTAKEAGYEDMVVKKCADLGVDRKEAKYATGTIKVTGRGNSLLPANTMVSTVEGLVYYTQTDLILDNSGVGYVDIKAKEAGAKYNVEANTITVFPLKYSGIISISNEEELVDGYNLESIDELLNRYYFKLREVSTSGNINHYKIWALEVNNVGDAKVFEETNDIFEKQKGHVCIVIVDSNGTGADEKLITNTYNHIEKNRPVGAKVHVLSAIEKTINISANLTLDTSLTNIDTAIANINTILKNTFKEMAFNNSVISYAKIGASILNVNGVVDYTNLLVNDGTSNITLSNVEIPVLGTTNFIENEV